MSQTFARQAIYEAILAQEYPEVVAFNISKNVPPDDEMTELFETRLEKALKMAQTWSQEQTQREISNLEYRRSSLESEIDVINQRLAELGAS